jgi:hypothetical protein
MKIRLVIIMLSIAFVSQLRAATIAVSNLGQPTAPFTYALGRSYPDSDFLEAVSFTTGPGTHDLASVVLSFYSRSTAAHADNPYTRDTETVLRSLAELQPETLAVMHGSSYLGRSDRLLTDLAGVIRGAFDPA